MADAGRAWAPQTYSNDDTILSWDLINEPRCERIGCDTEMLAWIEEMAPYVKALDGNHLLTVGAPAAVFLFFFFFFFFFSRRRCHGPPPNACELGQCAGAPARAGRRAGGACCTLRGSTLGGPAGTPLAAGAGMHGRQPADRTRACLA